jgi:thiol-disulfide isomerase/thioredoxin
MKSKISLLILCLSLIISACSQKEKTCIINGKVINRPLSTQLILTKSFEDSRSKSAEIINIKDSAFQFEINFKYVEAYTLIFNDEHEQGRMRPIIFFTSNDTIKMELYPMNDYEKNVISGGFENKMFSEHKKKEMNETEEKTKVIRDSMQILKTNDTYNSQAMKSLKKKLENTEIEEEEDKIYVQINELYESGEALSPVAKSLRAQYDSIIKLINDKELSYIKSNVSIFNYYSLIRTIINTKYSKDFSSFDELSMLQKKYAEKYKSHPYTKYSNEVMWRFANMKPGGNFYDFTLPDTTGTKYTLSEEIKGKYAFIDIWAPWCGPCIAKSRDMKPVFDSYKDKGFTIVGVASKYDEFENVIKLLEKDKYPWKTLIDKPEIDSRINEHYGIEMAGGGCVLVDKTGKIVLVNPTVEEVKKVLETSL